MALAALVFAAALARRPALEAAGDRGAVAARSPPSHSCPARLIGWTVAQCAARKPDRRAIGSARSPGPRSRRSRRSPARRRWPAGARTPTLRPDSRPARGARPRRSLALLLGAALIVLAVLSVQAALGLVFDPRYRDFPFAPLTGAAFRCSSVA